MLIEIRNTDFINKGAELMLYACLQKMRQAYPDARFAMAPNISSEAFERRMELGLFQKAWLCRYGFQWGNLAALVPGKIREMYGVVLDKEIDLVLDASGFAYSDQWGVSRSLELAKSCRGWKKNGTKIILLPQAFGPFNSTKIKEAIKTVANSADLIFARERISYDHLVGVVGKRPNIKIAPDFTNLVEGVLPEDFDTTDKHFCIIPNYRMVDKTPKEQSEAYLPFMIECAKYLLEKGQKPFVLIHERGSDIILAEKMRVEVGGVLPVVVENHPLKIKGILGACKGVIGSRFHGLVSALSQGVPSLATGWSHKYRMLFEDYDFVEGLMDVKANKKEIYGKIDLIIGAESWLRIKKNICARSDTNKQRSEEMWRELFYCLR